MSEFAHLFGIVVSGRPLMCEWSPISAERCVARLANPGAVPELTFFLLPGTVIPPGFGAILYFTAPPKGDWEILGSIMPEKPSGVFRTGWPSRGDMHVAEIQLGVELAPMERINNLQLTRSGYDDRFAYASKVAQDLYNFMTSFSTPQQEMMVVPTNVFDRWRTRFEAKYRRDPEFMMKDHS